MLPTPSQRAIAGSLAALAALLCVLAAAYRPPPAPWLLWLGLPLLAYARMQIDPRRASLWRGGEGRARALLAAALPVAA